MTQPTHSTSLSLPARLVTYLGPPSVVLLTSFGSPQAALLSPLTFVPTGLFFDEWRRSNSKDGTAARRGELEPMIWIYATMATVGLPTAAALQLGLGSALTTLLFGTGELKDTYLTEFLRSSVDDLTTNEIAQRAALASSWQNWVFIGTVAFSAMSLVEETLKALPIVYASRRRRQSQTDKSKQGSRAYLDYAIAGGLSFGAIESILYIYAACQQKNDSFARTALLAAGRLTFGTIGHALLVSLTAMRAIRKDYYGDRLNWLQVVGPSTLIHGVWNFTALAASSLEGNVGWVHPKGVGLSVTMYGLAVGVVTGLAALVNNEWKSLTSREQKREA